MFDPLVNHNRRVWDNLSRHGHTLTKPVTKKELDQARKILDPVGWLPSELAGKKVLALAAGGGRFSALFAALKADVTVVDISDEMLDTDRQMSSRYNLPMRILHADMCDLNQCQDAEFDLIMQPVSTCYVADPRFVFSEAARVLKSSGVYISFHKQPTNLQASLEWRTDSYQICKPLGQAIHNASNEASRLREAGAIEHPHSLQMLLGGLCRAGFLIEDVLEPQYANLNQPPGSFAHRCAYIAPYLAIKAVRKTSTKLVGL